MYLLTTKGVLFNSCCREICYFIVIISVYKSPNCCFWPHFTGNCITSEDYSILFDSTHLWGCVQYQKID